LLPSTFSLISFTKPALEVSDSITLHVTDIKRKH
jgi:hypothetical protein